MKLQLARPRAHQVAATKAVVRWYVDTHFRRPSDPGVVERFCDPSRVGSFAVERRALHAGDGRALFRLLVATSMFQRRQDVQILRILQVMEAADAAEICDPDSRIAKMKAGRTHLACRVEHAVDLESQMVIASAIQPANRSDAASLEQMVAKAREMLATIEHDVTVEEIAADKGYRSISALSFLASGQICSYVPKKKQICWQRWTGKSDHKERAVLSDDRRAKGRRGHRLRRRRSERVERSFAHICETSGARRSWLRGFGNVAKRYLMTIAAHNVERVLLAMIGAGKPRSFQKALLVALRAGVELVALVLTLATAWPARRSARSGFGPQRLSDPDGIDRRGVIAFSTGC